MEDETDVWLFLPAQLAHLNKRTPGKLWTKAQLDKHASRGTGFKYKFMLGKRATKAAWIDEWLTTLLTEPAPTKPRPAGNGGKPKKSLTQAAA